MESPKLLPCPFCGATEESGLVSAEMYKHDPVAIYCVTCKGCGMSMIPLSIYELWGFSKYSAIKHWNYRKQKGTD